MNITRPDRTSNVIPFPMERVAMKALRQPSEPWQGMPFVAVGPMFGSQPKSRFEFELKLSPQQAVDKLRQAIDIDKLRFAHTQSSGWLFGVQRGKKDFVGEIHGNYFRVMKWINYNNPHTPILEGRFIQTPNGNVRLVADFTILEETQKFTQRLPILGKGLEYLGRALGRKDELALSKFITELFKSSKI